MQPIKLILIEAVFNVPASVTPLIRLMIQKPLSLSHGIGFDPHPTASARQTGGHGSAAAAAMGATPPRGDHRDRRGALARSARAR